MLISSILSCMPFIKCDYKTTFTTKTLLKDTKLGKVSNKKKNAEGYNSISYKVKYLNSCCTEIYR